MRRGQSRRRQLERERCTSSAAGTVPATKALGGAQPELGVVAGVADQVQRLACRGKSPPSTTPRRRGAIHMPMLDALISDTLYDRRLMRKRGPICSL